MEVFMKYKTMALEMVRQRRQLHRQLCQEKQLLEAVERHARQLRATHEIWKQRLMESRPGSESNQIASEALELALKDMEDYLDNASQLNDHDPLSLDGAMAFLRRHSPHA
jgi:hypothetical protein